MMEKKTFLPRRTYSLGLEDSFQPSFNSRTREISNAISNRDPSSLLTMSFTKGTVSGLKSKEEPFDSSIHLRLVKNSIDTQRLVTGRGDKTISVLRHELKQIELEEAKHEFLLRKNTQKLKDLQETIEETVKKQGEEVNNQEIYHHLLRRMKKTKIFLEIESGVLNASLKVSESVLAEEKRKFLLSKEAAMQARMTFKDFEKTIRQEKEHGEVQISGMQSSIEKNLESHERRENWKKHKDTMFEAAVIEDRSAKSLDIKEGVILHRLWYKVLTKIYGRKKEKSQKLEEAFQKIKTATGIPEIHLIVENFLTKEQTYFELMRTVSAKEVECARYKKKIQDLQVGVDSHSNRTESNYLEIETQRVSQEMKIHELFDLSQKKYFVGNIRSKVRTWMKLMIRKFYRILGVTVNELKEDESLLYYLRIIADVLRNAKSGRKDLLGKMVEDNRKLAVSTMIGDISRIPHSFVEEEVMDENSLVAAANELDGK